MELISYSMDFSSFIMQNLKEKEKIKAIILFGSVARNEAGKNSDVDIFIDAYNEDEKLNNKIQEIKEKFLSSSKYKNYWKLLGITNPINIIVGELDKWSLKDTMLGNSIILYQKYSPKLEKGENVAIISWENINSNSKRVMLNKALFGYKHYKYTYPGFIEQYKGEKLSTNTILINIGNLNEAIKIFRKFGAKIKIKRLFSYN